MLAVKRDKKHDAASSHQYPHAILKDLFAHNIKIEMRFIYMFKQIATANKQ